MSSPRERALLVLPHVFVIPPEEEQLETPPFCCFDADDPYHTESDSEGYGELYEHERKCFADDNYCPEASSSAPVFHCLQLDDDELQPCVSVMAWKNKVPEAARSNPYIDVRERNRDKRDNSDVAEVIKVRRTKDRCALKNEPRVTHSPTFKERASRAFKSLKNVGKTGARKPNSKEPLASTGSGLGATKSIDSCNQPQGSTRTNGETASDITSLKRRASRSLSQFFHSAKPFTSDARPPPSLQAIPSDTSSSLAYLCRTCSRPPVGLPDTDEGDGMEYPTSPGLSARDSRKRFSVKEIHCMFSFSATPDEESSPQFSSVTSPSISTSSEPDVPIEETAYTAICFIDVEDGINQHKMQHCSSTYNNSPHDEDTGDVGFELRLDSLHFDPLSFNPDVFDVSMDDADAQRVRC